MGLVAAGFLFGGLAGGTAFTIVCLMPGEGPVSGAFETGAIFGAPLGAITAPLLSWLLLRRVPLGRMFVLCAVGTAVGGIVGWFVGSAFNNILDPIVGAFAGCVTATIALRYRVQRT